MSTIDRPQPVTTPPLEPGQRLDRATFHARYEAMSPGTRAELIEGVVCMPSPLSFDHADDNVPVVIWLDHYAESTPGVRVSINASTLLDDLGEPQPDVSLRILPESGGQTRIEGDYIGGAPELIVEIARSSRKIDLGPKFRDYERAGAREYVVMELDPNKIHWFIRREAENFSMVEELVVCAEPYTRWGRGRNVSPPCKGGVGGGKSSALVSPTPEEPPSIPPLQGGTEKILSLRGEHLLPLPPGPDGLFRSEVFPGLWLDPEALFAGDRARLRAAVDRGLETPKHAAFVVRLEQARNAP